MKEPERANRAVHTALATAVIFGIGAAIVGECFAGPAMDWLSVPEAVRDDALTYLRVYLLGMPFIAIYNFLAAVMRSQGDTQTPVSYTHLVMPRSSRNSWMSMMRQPGKMRSNSYSSSALMQVPQLTTTVLMSR